MMETRCDCGHISRSWPDRDVAMLVCPRCQSREKPRNTTYDIVTALDGVMPTLDRDPLPEPAPAGRGYQPPPCERCGKTFKTPAGARWHATNNRDCERWQKRKVA